MDEEEIFEDQVADYWIDYYKTENKLIKSI